MSWQATAWVIAHSKHKGSALLTLLCIANCANDDGTDAFPSISRLAQDTRLSSRQVLRIVDQLEKSGELRVRHSEGRQLNHYSLPLMNSDILSPLPKKPTVTKKRANSDISGRNGDINSDTAKSPDPSVIERSIEQSIDPPYRGVDFLAALKDFDQSRARMKKPLTPEARRLLYKKLAGWPEQVATQALEDSVINRWQGVFEPKPTNGRIQPNGVRPLDAAERNAARYSENLEFISDLRRSGGRDPH